MNFKKPVGERVKGIRRLVLVVFLGVLFWGDGRPAQEGVNSPTTRILVGADTVLSPPETEWRRERQLETRDSFGVFHDFQFSDLIEESGIRFLHRCAMIPGSIGNRCTTTTATGSP